MTIGWYCYFLVRRWRRLWYIIWYHVSLRYLWGFWPWWVAAWTELKAWRLPL